jgi:hypothetical protein
MSSSPRVEKILAAPAAVAYGASSDSWPMLGGDADAWPRSVRRRPPGRQARGDPLRPFKPAPDAAGGPQSQRARKAGVGEGMGINVMPVVDRGEIFYQDNQRI